MTSPPSLEIPRQRTAHYRELRATLPPEMLRATRRAEKVPQHPADLRLVKSFITERDARALLNLAQAAYAHQGNFARTWVPLPKRNSDSLIFRTEQQGLVGLLRCIAHDLDQACRIPLGVQPHGFLRLHHPLEIPPKAYDDSLAWLLALNNDHKGGNSFIPSFQTAFTMHPGDALLFPRKHTPGVSKLAQGPARYTVEAYPPPLSIANPIDSLPQATKSKIASNRT